MFVPLLHPKRFLDPTYSFRARVGQKFWQKSIAGAFGPITPPITQWQTLNLTHFCRGLLQIKCINFMNIGQTGRPCAESKWSPPGATKFENLCIFHVFGAEAPKMGRSTRNLARRWRWSVNPVGHAGRKIDSTPRSENNTGILDINNKQILVVRWNILKLLKQSNLNFDVQTWKVTFTYIIISSANTNIQQTQCNRAQQWMKLNH